MGSKGRDALERSQASAEADAGSIASPSQECLTWIGVAAAYDDPWTTPITDCQVRIEIDGDLVADGPRTKGLSAFGKEDGQPHHDVRAMLGSYRHEGVKHGPAIITLGLTSPPESTETVEKEISDELTALETSMRALLQPWITEWSSHGWRSVSEARLRGELRGLGAWWEGEVGFWSSLGSGAKEAWDGIKDGAGKVADWYGSLPWYEKVAPGIAVEHELVKRSIQGIEALWGRREQLMNLLKAFSSGTVSTIERALSALTDLPGELGELIKALVHHGADWVQRMIEVVRETDVIERTIDTIMSIVMMMTPNFWAEGIGVIAGYLLPEVLVTIVLTFIGSLCAAAGAALGARIAAFLSKLRKAIGAIPKIGEVLSTLFSKLERIFQKVARLAKALYGRIKGKIKGATKRLNKWLRSSRKRFGLNMAKQGKHIPGHPNYIPGKSPFTHKDPEGLFKRFAGKGQPVGKVPRGQPGFKERVDFREIIGEINGKPTTKGIIHYAIDGAHIVPAKP